VLIWIWRMRVVTEGPVPPEMRTAGPRPSVWRSLLAWQVTLTMGLQSTVFYTLVIWLPSIEADAKIPPAAAGAHLFVFQAVGIGSALVVSALMTRARDQRLIASLITVPILIAFAGMLISPGLVLVWVGFAGLTSGGSITVALALIGLRTRVPADTARLSGMTQGVGYLLASCGPIVAGWMRAATGTWTAVIALLIVLTVLQGIVGFLAGRNRFVGDSRRTAGISPR
jgi:MFS transporter, CP family, cyanate transporter